MRLLFTFLLIGISTLSACQNKDNHPPQTYFGYLTADPKTLDPAVAYDATSWDVMGVVYETLFQYSYLQDPYQVEPLLAADRPKFSRDHKTVTFRIRDDVTYHGTQRKLKAEDFITAWKRLALPSVESQGFWIFESRIQGFDEYRKKAISGSEKDIKKLLELPVPGLVAKDDHTLVVHLTRPYPQLLYVLTLPFTAPLPKEILFEKMDEKGNLNEEMIGTGPFYLSRWERNNVITLDRSPEFHTDFYPTQGNPEFKKLGLFQDAGKLLPFLERIHLRIIKEEQPAWLEFMSGKLDKTQIPKDNFGEALSNRVNLSDDLKAKGIQLAIQPEASFYYLSINMKDPVIGKNKKIRQTISRAIDREKFIDLFLNGRGTKMTSALPPGIPDRQKDSKLKYDFDLKKAKEMKLPPTELTLDFPDSTSYSRQVGEFMSRQLQEVGIQLKVIYNTYASYTEKIKNSNFQMIFARWILDYPDGENVFQLLYGPNQSPGPNSSSFNHSQFNSLYRTTADLESSPRREKMITEMDQIIQEELPWIYLCNRIAYRLNQPWLKNYRQAEMILNKFKYYKIDTEKKNSH